METSIFGELLCIEQLTHIKQYQNNENNFGLFFLKIMYKQYYLIVGKYLLLLYETFHLDSSRGLRTKKPIKLKTDFLRLHRVLTNSRIYKINLFHLKKIIK